MHLHFMSHSGTLFKIQVAQIRVTNFTGLLLLMQKWQTVTLALTVGDLHLCSLQSHGADEAPSAPGIRLVSAEWPPWL